MIKETLEAQRDEAMESWREAARPLISGSLTLANVSAMEDRRRHLIEAEASLQGALLMWTSAEIAYENGDKAMAEHERLQSKAKERRQEQREA